MLSPFVHQVPSIQSPFLNRRRGAVGSVVAFSPASLYSSGAQGIWLDPSDLATMFSDPTGTTPVTTPGTVVGLRLDKSKGLVLGAELVNNGNFSAGSTEYVQVLNGTISYASQTMLATGTTGNTGVYQDVAVTANRSYQVSWQQISGTDRRVGVYDGAGFGTPLYTSSDTITGTRTAIVRPTTTTIRVYLSTPAGNTAEFDNISVKELPGNHATQSTLAARPTYGIEPMGGRRNLLTYSEDFSNAAWLKFNPPTIAQNDVAAPNGALTACRVTLTSTSKSSIYQATSTNGIPARRGIYAKFGTARFLWFEATSTTPTVWFDLQNGTVSGNTSGGTASISDVGNGWYLCSVAVSASATNFSFGFSNASGSEVQTVGQYSWVWGAQIELGSTATPYQKVTTEYDVTEAGVPTCHYVAYGGAHSMSTAAINFTGTDKMSVFAGVRKLSDPAAGIVVESSDTVENNTGSIIVFTNPGVYGAKLRGTFNQQAISTASTYAPPVSSILTAFGDIAADINTLRVDGVQKAQSTSDQGTGNFGNYPLFIGRRNNATLPFNGRDYGIIIVGKTASPTEISTTEAWLGDKTGFSAPVITGVPTIGVS